MHKKNFLLLGSLVAIIFICWFAYLKATDDTYEGMSIIPEDYKDIPLFEGLKPTRNNYVIKGNRWEDVYNYYMNQLPEHGWKVEYEQSALEDNEIENDWSGFHSRWRKEGFDGELWISASYNQYEEQTEILFDKTQIYTTTFWIDELPDNICIYETLQAENCFEIKDKTKINELTSLINSAFDFNEEKLPQREKISIIEFGNLEIKVHYGSDQEIYFQSAKGMKRMKPEPEFFELTNLPQ